LRWLRCGKLTASKPGRKWLVSSQDLERFLAEHKN
jgi:excisionase family DNA binding protein